MKNEKTEIAASKPTKQKQAKSKGPTLLKQASVVLSNNVSQLNANILYEQKLEKQKKREEKQKLKMIESGAKVSVQRKAATNHRCPHKDVKHYAKGMCNRCYHIYGRASLATKCPHKDMMNYAKGRCQNCYFTNYNREKEMKNKSTTSQTKK